ncbi:MAG: glycosyltransferase family 4 protein [Thermoleophilia bacterium]|nr:glycosyltransferase family 4 protein [Thermoleophilia bacterium]
MPKVVFVSFRLGASDGVSVEAEKWSRVFRELGYRTCRVAGYIPEPGNSDRVIPEMNHRDPLIDPFTATAFSRDPNRHDLQRELALLTTSLERELLAVLAEIDADIMVAENVFSLPVNIPLTMVLGRFLSEERLPCIAVHHDFYWEHARFQHCAMGELLASHFPPALPQMRHVTINIQARKELSRRTGITATCVRNCFDFESPRQNDEFNAGLRRDLGIDNSDLLFLQPTRAIPRKGIDRAIRFAAEFQEISGWSSKLFLPGAVEDGYETELARLCRESRIEVIHKPGWLGSRRDDPKAGSRYDVPDAYACCDMVTFPSLWEGFGNPVLESVVHRKPLLVGEYPVLDELRAFGFQFLPLDEGAVSRAVKLMDSPVLLKEMADRNFAIGKRHFSLASLKDELGALVASLVFQ